MQREQSGVRHDSEEVWDERFRVTVGILVLQRMQVSNEGSDDVGYVVIEAFREGEGSRAPVITNDGLEKALYLVGVRCVAVEACQCSAMS